MATSRAGTQRTYVYVIGDVTYQSLTVSAKAGTSHLTFYRQPSEGAATLDPAHNYLRYADQAKHAKVGSHHHLQGGPERSDRHLRVHRAGSYVSSVTLTVQSASVSLVISQVGSSPPVVSPPVHGSSPLLLALAVAQLAAGQPAAAQPVCWLGRKSSAAEGSP